MRMGWGGYACLMSQVQDRPRPKFEDMKRRTCSPRWGTHMCPSICIKLKSANYVIKGYNSRGNKSAMLEPNPRTSALYCLAQQLQLHNGLSTHSTCICISPCSFLFFACFTWSGGCVCVCVMQEPTTPFRIINGATISGVELVGTALGPPPPPPPVPTFLLCFVTGLSQLSDKT